MGKVSYTYILFYFLTGLGPLFHQLAQGKEHFVTHSTPQPQEVTFACPTGLTPLFTDEQVCSGDFINVPPDDVILDNVDVNESAFVQWDMDVTAPVFNNSPNCEIIEIQYNYFILCTEQPSFILEGGSHFVTVFPDLHPPVIEVDADCNFNIIPHCPDDVVNPPVVNPDLSEQDFAVVNPLGCSVIFTIPIPDCFLPIEVFDLIVIPNCNEYFVEFSIAGGTGNYLINGSPLPPGQSTFSSDAIPCETPFNFDVTDDMGTDVVPIFGEGTACLPPLTTTAPSININGLQYEVSFTILGGTGNYMVDGQPLTGATFTSQPIACGQPFSFLVDDGCEVLTVSGGPVVCYDPITASPAEIIQNCNEYQVSFMIEGGTGNYVINGIPLPPGQNSFLSDLLPCGTAFNFQITDDLSTDLITVSGNGTACLPPLITSDALINTIGGQYEVSFNISGGTGIYTVNGIPIPGDTFTSNLIDCGLPFSFLVSDNCETSAVESGPVQCFEPITVTEPVIIQNCNQYQVSITISGGTGNYVVNGTPLPPGQNTATSQFVPCGTNFFIQVTDDQATDVVDINGSGPACLPPLFTSDPIIEVVGLQYQVTFGIQGGTGDYTVNGQPVAGNTFTSGLIPCGLPYSFEVSDGCQTLFISELLVQCYPPITAEVQINTECNTFQVTLFLGGGTGNYVINGISLAPGQVEFVSNTFDCEAGYIFQITDDLGSDEIQIADIGPACFEELAVSPPTTEIQGNQYRISFTLSNGTGNYFVDGQSLDGNIFTSDLIDCGTPYSFVVSDLCNEVPVAGEGPQCLDPVAVSEIETESICNQYTAQFNVSGGSGEYAINDIPIPSDLFISDFLACETPYDFVVADLQTGETININGTGPDCNTPLTISPVETGQIGNQYTAQFTASGGTGTYEVNGIPLPGDVFISDPIDCGQPYSFQLSDGCELIPIDGGPIDCLPPLMASDVFIGPICNQFTAQFTISGGSGEYAVDGIAVPGDLFTSDLIDCVDFYDFELTDQQTGESIDVSGMGSACNDPLVATLIEIEIIDGEYFVRAFLSGGTGEYVADGIPFSGDIFVSDPIDCGQPYDFILGDGCETIPVEGGPIDCFPPLMTSDIFIGPICNEFTAQFTVNGGSGDYAVNDIPLPGDLFISDLLECETPYDFVVSDLESGETINLNGTGPDCNDPLMTSSVELGALGNQYTAQFTVSGGSGEYEVDGFVLPGNHFISDLIDCGEPYIFGVSDGCESIELAGDGVNCPPAIFTSDVFVGPQCNQYTVQFTVGGGSGEYAVDGIPIPGDHYVSDYMECETPFSFEVSDEETGESVNVNGAGPDCSDPLTASLLDIEIIENQFIVSISITGGSGEYEVNGIPIPGDLFVSDPIDCGLPYSFEVADGCEVVPVEGGPVNCLPPLTTSEPFVGPVCNQFTAQFSIGGGSGEYLVDGIPLPGDLFISDLLDCEAPFDFNVTDQQTGESVDVSGNGPECNDPLTTSPVEIGVIGDQYTAQFTTSGGSGEYEVNGIPIPGDLFVSDPIDCGLPYSFEVADGCEVIPVEGGPVNCLPPLTTSEPFIGPVCNQFTAQFSIGGGSGEYLVDGIPLPGDLFISDLLDCEAPFDFNVTDQQTGESVDVSGNGPECNDPLTTSPVEIGVIGDQYTAQFTTSGGSGDYEVNGIPIPGDLFVSDPIDCGLPYSFEVADGCEVIPVEGGPVNCLPPLTTSEPFIGPVCNQFTAQFSIGGGSGEYLVDGIPLPGDLFISDLLDCEAPFDFNVTDQQTGESVDVSGNGPECNDPLTTSPVEIGVMGDQYTAQFTTSGGSGDYEVNGIPLPGNLFISDPIDCGLPYSFEVADGCEVVPVEGGPVNCLPPLTTSEPFIGPICNQFTAQFSISGGSGEYLVDGIPLPGDLFISDLLDCGTPFSFEVTDQQNSDPVTVAGEGPICPDPLTTSPVETAVDGTQYTAQFNITGGSGEYVVNDIPLSSNLFISDLIECGEPYAFTLDDGCETLTISGPSPCQPCPEMINDFTTQLEQCQGELPMLPSDDDILTNIDVPEHAIIEWSGDPNVPLEHPGSCEPSLQSFALSIKCATDTSVNLDGGIITILVYPEPTAPTVVLTDSTEMTCFYEVIPACDHDTVEPSTIQAPNGTIGSTIDIVVANPGCSQGITYTVSIPDCMLVGLEDQGVNPFDLSIHRNPFGEGEKLGIQFTIANRQEMRLTVYDLNGRTVKTLRRQSFTEGTHYIEWDGRATNGRMVPAGMYLIELHTPENRHIAKVVKYE